MRFALDISKAASFDGLGTWIRELIRALNRLESERETKSKHEWLLVDLLQEQGERALEALGPLGKSFHPALDTHLLASEVDALLATSWTLPATPPPTLFVAYDLTVFSHPECHTLTNRMHVSEGLLRARLTDSRFLAISEATARELDRWLGIPEEKIDVVLPGLGSDFRFDNRIDRLASLERTRRRFDLKNAEGYVLSVGSLEPRKNLRRLFDSHRCLPEATRLRFPLLLAGGAAWRHEELEHRLSQEPTEFVQRLGKVKQNELIDLYGGATLFVYPSLAEGFGLPVAEAMACGAPVITSDLSSLPEVAGSAASQIDPTDIGALTDALKSLLNDSEARERLRKLGYERARQLSWTTASSLILNSLENVSKARPRTAP